jgi:predicted nucleic acid-binding protein
MARPQRHRGQQRVRETPSTRYASPPAPGDVTGILLDSDVIIEVLRGRRKTIDELLAIERRGVSTYCCAVSWAEIFAGLRPGEEVVTEAFFYARGDVTIDAATGRRAGVYLASSAKSQGLEIADALVAAAATTVGFHLWTLNRKHYPMEDLRFHEGADGR